MVFRHFEYAKAKNTHHMGKYHSTADLLFDWFGFDQTSKADANSTKAKQLIPNKKTRGQPYSDAPLTKSLSVVVAQLAD